MDSQMNAIDLRHASAPRFGAAPRQAAAPRRAALGAGAAPLELGTLDGPEALGPIFVALSGRRLCALGFDVQDGALRRGLARRFGEAAAAAPAPAGPRTEALARVAEALARYFGGDLSALAALETDARGTPFQERVWSALREIPPGETRSYGELARSLGDPRAVRAVGTANGRNPISLVVPCHRVIGKDGALTGYAGGLARKRWLLEHEARHAGRG